MGRGAEISSLLELLRSPDVGLVTITGRSGSGKTRLAAEVARQVGPDLAGGAVVVDCASIDDPESVAAAVAAALDLSVVAGQRPEDALRRSLQYEPTLILADDLDHVPDAVAVLQDILDDCPGSHLLATAAAPLRARGERVVRLGTLQLPMESTADPLAILGAPAIALFCDRAGAVDAGFRCTAENAGSIAGLVERLDGLPLAIELAAARVTTLSPAAQLDMLAHSSPLDLAPLGVADRKGRHTELRSALAWSHRLLGLREQALFRRLAVFDGTCSLEAIRDVGGERAWGSAGFLDALTTLVDVHLVEPDTEAGGGTRYHLLPTVVDYARELLVEARETKRMTARHTDWFVALTQRAADLGEQAQVRVLVADRGNLHAALGRLVEAGDVSRGLRLAADLAPLWFRQGLFPRTRDWFDKLLIAAPGAEVRDEVHARALLWRALLAADDPVDRDQGTTAARLEEGLRLARESGSDDALLFGLACTIRTIFVTRDMTGAAIAARDGLALSERIGDEANKTRFLCWAGMVAGQLGDREMSVRLASDALERATQSGDLATVVRASVHLRGLPPGTPGVPDAIPPREALLGICRDIGDVVAEGWMIGALAWRALADGDRARAATWCVDGLRLAQRTGALSSGGFALATLVIAACGKGDDEIAAVLHGSLTNVMPSLQVGLTAEPTKVYLATVEAARARLGPGEFDAVAAEGALLPWDSALAAGLEYASALARRPTPAVVGGKEDLGAPRLRGGVERLTPRELDVLRLLARGDSNRDIAEALGLRPKTVMHHSVSIYGKLGLRGRAEATAWAFRNGVVEETGAA
jgi:predicted ATPase/DNA-binding CsgD family transcriptional regulator